MAEYIERETALTCFHDWIDRRGDVHTPDEMEEYRALESLPAADVRPVVRGKWLSLWVEDDETIGDGYTVPQCSVCKEDSYGTTPFCPFCGADMREES